MFLGRKGEGIEFLHLLLFLSCLQSKNPCAKVAFYGVVCFDTLHPLSLVFKITVNANFLKFSFAVVCCLYKECSEYLY